MQRAGNQRGKERWRSFTFERYIIVCGVELSNHNVQQAKEAKKMICHFFACYERLFWSVLLTNPCFKQY